MHRERHAVQAVLDPCRHDSRYLGVEMNHRVGNPRKLNAEYFKRIDALDFAMYHDDGQQHVDLADADVILVGVSRTSKTPTCVYLAHRGVKAANVPMVPGVPLPPEVFVKDGPLVVGLLISADRLILSAATASPHEGNARRQLYHEDSCARGDGCAKHRGKVADDRCSRRSIEETAAAC
jgi:regulator of PEP synthase PpsR (kinase-PPPase family)